jgi:hypothetical protein
MSTRTRNWEQVVSENYDSFYERRRQLRQQSREKEREYSGDAVQTTLDGLAYIDEQMLRPVRSAVGASAEEFVSSDVSYTRPSVTGVNMSNPTQEIPDRVLPKESVNAALDMALHPTNLVGAGLLTGGTKAVNRLTGALSGRGMVPSSPSNYIPNYYAPTDMAEGATPGMLDNLLFKGKDRIASVVSPIPKVGRRVAPVLRDIANPQEMMEARTKAQDFTKWGMQGLSRAQDNLLSPEARALYRDTGINRSFRDDARALLQDADAMSGSSRRPETKAIAQGQFNYLVGEQAGRQGARGEALEEIRRRSYLTEAVPFEQGSYSDLVMSKKLSGTVEDAKGQSRKLTPRKADLDFIEEHMGNVWKGRGDEKLKDAATPKLVIKTPTGKYTGNHKFDFQQKSGVFPLMKKIFGENKNPTKEEFYDLLQKHTGDKVKIHPNSGSENGYWVTGSFTGTAVTEGGVNFIAKVQPNGRIMAVVSDEHNFLEKTPVVGAAVEEALPNRIVAATPPMFFDAKSAAKTKAAQAETGEQKYREVLEGIATAKPRKEVLRAEQARQAGAGMLVGRMATGGQDEEG